MFNVNDDIYLTLKSYKSVNIYIVNKHIWPCKVYISKGLADCYEHSDLTHAYLGKNITDIPVLISTASTDNLH